MTGAGVVALALQGDCTGTDCTAPEPFPHEAPLRAINRATAPVDTVRILRCITPMPARGSRRRTSGRIVNRRTGLRPAPPRNSQSSPTE
jgi:hypothetical protein